MNGAFKPLSKRNTYETDYVAQKQWSVSGSIDNPDSEICQLGINCRLATKPEQEALYSNDPHYAENLLYREIDVKYYRNFREDGCTISGSLDQSIQTSLTLEGTRHLGDEALVISIPGKVIGIGIEPKSFIYNSSVGEIRDVFGEGTISCWDSDDLVPGKECVGNIIYSEGIIIITDEDLIGELKDTLGYLDLSFYSNVPIFSYNYICNVRDIEMNYTYNPSAKLVDQNQDFTPYITGVGLYNSAGELLAVAKTSKPIKKLSNIDTSFVVRVDMF